MQLQHILIFFIPCNTICLLLNTYCLYKGGTAVAQWLRCCATNRKVAGSIQAGVIGIFHWHKILPIELWPWGWNLVSLNSWNPLGHSRPVMGLLYLYLYLRKGYTQNTQPSLLHVSAVDHHLQGAKPKTCYMCRSLKMAVDRRNM